jgi:hypothetical protein
MGIPSHCSAQSVTSCDEMPKKRDETSNPVQQRPLFPVVAEAPSELQPEYNELLVEYLSAFESSGARRQRALASQSTTPAALRRAFSLIKATQK